MNRIILIGNGFDLAHGLKTSFPDFLNYYWGKVMTEIARCQPGSRFCNEDIVIDSRPHSFQEGEDNYTTIQQSIDQAGTKLRWKNKFLKTITHRNSEVKWVDIENEYYSSLVKTYQKEQVYPISDLNRDFNSIKKSLEKYISDIENASDISQEKCIPQITSKIYSRFDLNDFTEEAINEKAHIELHKAKENFKKAQPDPFVRDELTDEERRLITKLGTDDDYLMIRKLLLSQAAPHYFDLFPVKTLFLNFNYTNSDKHYKYPNTVYFKNLDHKFETDRIHIHGSVYTSEKNPIIFGFGDEIDENYKAIENLNDNTYLEHIKSIKYLETDNYKKLLEFMNSDKYQILIFGHSCGNSDRTLLNTLFEHPNCVSIKPYYYKQTETKDNYSELIMNITRNFNDKAALRDKVVNKKYCEPLYIS